MEKKWGKDKKKEKKNWWKNHEISQKNAEKSVEDNLGIPWDSLYLSALLGAGEELRRGGNGEKWDWGEKN